jgi:hypothetical protein
MSSEFNNQRTQSVCFKKLNGRSAYPATLLGETITLSSRNISSLPNHPSEKMNIKCIIHTQGGKRSGS